MTTKKEVLIKKYIEYQNEVKKLLIVVYCHH